MAARGHDAVRAWQREQLPGRRARALPPDPMPMLRRGRALKRWRYVAAFGPELMLCAAEVRIGPFAQRFFAIAEPGVAIVEETTLRPGLVTMQGSVVRISSPGLRAEIELDERAGVESVHRSGRRGYVWTRKQAGIDASVTLEAGGHVRELELQAVVDDTAGYHARHTRWQWSAGVGRSESGEALAWNLVSGVNDEPTDSERTVWIDGVAAEVEPVAFEADLSAVTFRGGSELRFRPWATRAARTNLLILRSAYRQPFGVFSGELPGGLRLSEGYGVMEWHDAHW